MTPRRRSKKYRGLETNLYASEKNGTVYYRYRRPDTRKEFPMGTNRAEAQDAARQLNARLMDGAGLAAKVMGSNSLGAVVERFKASEVDKDPDIAESTKREKGYRLNRIKKGLGHLAIVTIETKHIAQFLNTLTNDAYRQHRSVLSQIFDYAITQGLIRHNPVTPTQTRLKGVKKQRARLSIDQFKAIREIAPDWFKVAMDVSLLLCLGRNEVAALKFSDEKDGRLRYVRKKVEKYDSGRVSVEITPALREVLNRARSLPPLSQYIVSKPGRHGGVSPVMLTRWFKKLADKALGELPNPSTFHEIRALGSHVLESIERRGIEDIQHLMAHSDDKQTKVYTDGHGEKWVEAVAGNTTLW
jgi:integrase